LKEHEIGLFELLLEFVEAQFSGYNWGDLSGINHSTLAASALIILFSEMLKCVEFYFFPKRVNFFVKEKY
jgi:hypothetical protein